MSIQALPYVIFLAFLYGSTLVVSRFSVGQYHPTTYIGLRLVLASLGHAAIYLFSPGRRWPRNRELWFHATVLGLIGTAIPMTSIVSSLQYQSSGLTSILITANPALTVLLAHFFLADERLSPRKGLGILLAFSGALLLALRGETGLPDASQGNPLGYGLVFLAAISGSSAAIYVRKFMRNLDAFDVASVRMTAAALIVMPLSAIWVGIDLSGVNQAGYAALGYAALSGTFGAMFLIFYIIKRFGATAGAVTSYVVPIFAGIGGVLILGETITPGMLGGIGLIMLGLAALNQRQGNGQPPDREE